MWKSSGIAVHWFVLPFIYLFIHSAVCLATGPQPLPQESSPSSAFLFNLQYPFS